MAHHSCTSSTADHQQQQSDEEEGGQSMKCSSYSQEFQEVVNEDDDEEESFLFSIKTDSSQDVTQVKREHCSRCKRPLSVCICSCLPVEPLPIATNVIILQHHSEISRCLATVPILQQCISSDKLHVIRGKKIRLERYPWLKKAIQSESSILLYPTSTALSFHSLPSHPIGKDDHSALIVLDGTWAQTKSMYSQNRYLHSITQAKLVSTTSSQYTIRTQPSKYSLSTLESVAHALAWLEGRPEIIDVLVSPLSAMCRYQIDHGATVHYSKDHPQYMSRTDFKKRSNNDHESSKQSN